MRAMPLHIGLIFLLFAGTVFFTPDIVVDRFRTAPQLWVVEFAGLCCGIMLFAYPQKKSISLLPISFLAVALLWILYQIVRFEDALNTAVTLASYTLIFLCAFWSFSLHRAFRLFTPIILVTTSCACIGIAQYCLPSPTDEFVRGTFENRAGFSALIVATLPITLFEYRASTIRWIKIALGISLVLLTVSLILSGARAALFAFGILLLVHGWKHLRIPLRLKWLTVGILAITLLITLFYLKPDSVYGRWLIWESSIPLIFKQPLFGLDIESFGGYYMTAQANFLSAHPTDTWVWLASNTYRPFNEFLLLLIEQGLIGAIFAITIGIFVWRHYRNAPSPPKQAILWSIVAIGICAIFSYPMEYPAIRTLLFLFLGAIMTSERKPTHRSPIEKFGVLSLSSLSLALILIAGYQFYTEAKWKSIAESESPDLNRYEQLCQNPFLRNKVAFVYNHAIALHHAELFEASNSQLDEIANRMNDFDTQILRATNHLATSEFDKAEQHLREASRMIPNRFVPRYELFKLYCATGRHEKALEVAKTIDRLKPKVYSSTVAFIKSEITNYLNKKGGTTR